MKLKAKLESMDGIDKAIAALYAPGTGDLEGSFILQVEAVDGFALEDVAGLKTSLQKDKSRIKQLSEQLKPFEGLDPEAAKKAMAKMGEMDSWDPEQKQKEWKERTQRQFETAAETRVKQATEKYELQQKELLKDNESLSSQLNRVLVEENAMRAMTNPEHKVASPKLLLPHVIARTKVERLDDGRRQVVVVDDEGNVRLSLKPGSKQAPMSIDELVAEMKTKEDYQIAFAGSGGSGPGIKPGSSGGSGNISKTDKERLKALPAEERLKELRRNEGANLSQQSANK